jgi:transcriptional regulator with XRE-family HTH domain
MLGDRVRHRRDELDLTQEQLATMTGLKQFHISRIESGDIKDVKGETLRRLARALRVTSDFLLEIEGSENDLVAAAVA